MGVLKMAIKLVDNANSLHKSYSVILTVIIAILSVVEMLLPSMGLIEASMSPEMYGKVVFGLTILSVIGRYVKQHSVSGKPTEETGTLNEDTGNVSN